MKVRATALKPGNIMVNPDFSEFGKIKEIDPDRWEYPGDDSTKGRLYIGMAMENNAFVTVWENLEVEIEDRK